VFGVLRQSKCLVEADVGVDVEFGVGMQAVAERLGLAYQEERH
jgi:hypothetical protein